MNTNPIFQALVVSYADLLGAGQTLSDLNTGQLGIFDAETNLSVTGSTLPDKFYLAVGAIDGNGNQEVKKSAGQYIPKTLINRIDSMAPVGADDQTFYIDLTSFDPQYGGSYVLHFEFMSGQTMSLNGFQNPSKTFTVDVPSNGSGSYALADFCDLVAAEINNDDEAILTASNTGDVAVTVVVGSETLQASLAGINPRYSFIRQFTCTLGLKGDFETDIANITVTVTPPVFEEGSGYDIQRHEYVAAGWGETGIYRDSQLNGLFRNSGFTPDADANTSYWQMWMNWNFRSTSGGFLNYSNQMETLVAIPDEEEYQTLIDTLVTMAQTYLVTAQEQTQGTISNYGS